MRARSGLDASGKSRGIAGPQNTNSGNLSPLKQEEVMAKTFIQMAEEAMAKAHAVSVEEALQELKENPDALLVDVRDAE